MHVSHSLVCEMYSYACIAFLGFYFQKTHDLVTRVQQRAEQLIISHHFDAAAVQSMVRTLQERLEHTLMCAEDRQKLATSSATFFFTVDQVGFFQNLR